MSNYNVFACTPHVRLIWYFYSVTDDSFILTNLFRDVGFLPRQLFSNKLRLRFFHRISCFATAVVLATELWVTLKSWPAWQSFPFSQSVSRARALGQR